MKIPAPRYHPPRPAPIKAPAIDSRTFFTALTPEIAKEKLDTGEPFTFMCQSEQSYLTLGAYFQDVLRYTKQVNSVLDYYEDTQ